MRKASQFHYSLLSMQPAATKQQLTPLLVHWKPTLRYHATPRSHVLKTSGVAGYAHGASTPDSTTLKMKTRNGPNTTRTTLDDSNTYPCRSNAVSGFQEVSTCLNPTQMTQPHLPPSRILATPTGWDIADVERCGWKLVCTRLLVFPSSIAKFQQSRSTTAVFSEHISFIIPIFLQSVSICLLNVLTSLSHTFPTRWLSYSSLFTSYLSYRASRTTSLQPPAIFLLRRKQLMPRNFREVAHL